jgi:hypothetical protein
MPKRSLQELINKQEPGWQLVNSWIKEAKNKVQVLPKGPACADSALLAAQVTTRSPMGAVNTKPGVSLSITAGCAFWAQVALAWTAT